MEKSMINGIIELLITFLLGGGVGCLIGFRIGVHKTVKQSQKGGSGSTMSQIGVVSNGKH